MMKQPLDILLMGGRLRSCRIAKKMTMKDFAEQCGISERYLADIERGIKAPRLETFVGIVNAAGVSSVLICLVAVCCTVSYFWKNITAAAGYLRRPSGIRTLRGIRKTAEEILQSALLRRKGA